MRPRLLFLGPHQHRDAFGDSTANKNNRPRITWSRSQRSTGLLLCCLLFCPSKHGLLQTEAAKRPQGPYELTTIGVIKGDTTSLDNGSYDMLAFQGAYATDRSGTEHDKTGLQHNRKYPVLQGPKQ